jgi:hypothetical protein
VGRYTRYAQETEVPVEQTQREIEDLIERYGADHFMRGKSGTEALVAFRMNSCNVKFVLPIPTLEDCLYVPSRTRKTKDGGTERVKRSPGDQQRAYELTKRQRWRALKLSIQAKLEAVAAGISTFEREFLPFIVLPNGQTVGDEVIPRLPATFAAPGGHLFLPGGTS